MPFRVEGWGEGSNALQILDLTPPHPNLLPQGEGIKILYLNFLRVPLSRNKLKFNFEIGSKLQQLNIS